MKLWIRNILQNIINKIESEEDKTLPENYFNNIIIELQQLSNDRRSRNAFKEQRRRTNQV
jgi:hypothetical protein